MALYAFRDKDRKKQILAADAITEDRNNVFYCPNKSCNAHLHICAVDGIKRAYFRATEKAYRHVDGCQFASSDEFDIDQFDEDKFLFEDALSRLFMPSMPQEKRKIPGEHGKGIPEKHPPKTIRQIYSMCKSMPVNKKYGDKEICDMLLDERSFYRYPKGCFGHRLIEAKAETKLYDYTKNEIYVKAPIQGNGYIFIMHIQDEALFRKMRDEIYNNEDKIIVVAGKWESAGIFDHFATEIQSTKQVAVIKC